MASHEKNILNVENTGPAVGGAKSLHFGGCRAQVASHEKNILNVENTGPAVGGAKSLHFGGCRAQVGSREKNYLNMENPGPAVGVGGGKYLQPLIYIPFGQNCTHTRKL